MDTPLAKLVLMVLLTSARYRQKGRVLYFNFPLAGGGTDPRRPSAHPQQRPPNKPYSAFSLQIINEYDLKLGKKYSTETVPVLYGYSLSTNPTPQQAG